MASNSPYVKTRGEKRAGKQKASGNVPANDTDRPNCDGSDGRMATMEAKLDVIVERLQKLDVLEQLAAQVASLSTSLECCHASIAELKAETRVCGAGNDYLTRHRRAATASCERPRRGGSAGVAEHEGQPCVLRQR